MNSTDTTYAGVSTVTPPAVGLRCAASAELVVRMAPYAAPENGTGLLVAGTLPAVRLRGLIAVAGTSGSTTTGASFGADALPSVQRPAPKGGDVAGFEHTSSTPGDLPPEDPLS